MGWGQISLKLALFGEKPAAVDALKRALELNPEDKGAKEALREAGFLPINVFLARRTSGIHTGMVLTISH